MWEKRGEKHGERCGIRNEERVNTEEERMWMKSIHLPVSSKANRGWKRKGDRITLRVPSPCWHRVWEVWRLWIWHKFGEWTCTQLDDVTCLSPLTPLSCDWHVVQSSKHLCPLPSLPPLGPLTSSASDCKNNLSTKKSTWRNCVASTSLSLLLSLLRVTNRNKWRKKQLSG